jgi:hypothetical protein
MSVAVAVVEYQVKHGEIKAMQICFYEALLWL